MAVKQILLSEYDQMNFNNLSSIKISLGKTDAIGLLYEPFKKAIEKRTRRLQTYKRYHQSDKGKLNTKKHNNSVKGKARDRIFKERHRDEINKKQSERLEAQGYKKQILWAKNNPERMREIQHKHQVSPQRKQWKIENASRLLESQYKHFNKIKASLEEFTESLRCALLDWSRYVKSRDKKCQICGSKENLVSHHIFYKALYPKICLNKNNGITLCDLHHREIHYRIQVGEMI